MSRRTFEVEDEIEAAAMVHELSQLADATPEGHVLAVLEAATVERGRRFIRHATAGRFLKRTLATHVATGFLSRGFPLARHARTKDKPERRLGRSRRKP